MAEHYTRNTVSVTVYCAKCKGFTRHRVDGGRRGPCEECIARLQKESSERTEAAADPKRQIEMF